ncbi:MAG TPA: YbdK family carboxylate-amine ligase [Solirubrobacterales bacterium]|nr:YbdK family carboxylate-amine ligase [Solirubrobacterales bacterium]
MTDSASAAAPDPDWTLDLERVRATFEQSTDFTVALEEEFAIVDPASLDLEQRFEDLFAACQADALLAGSAKGELIASEIEIRSGRGGTFADAVERQRIHRARLFSIAEGMGLGLAATGTHPWANYLDQRIIDTPHYQRLQRDLGYVARRNNTWSLHVHMGVRGAERAIAVCDSLRAVLPILLAVSANSPFLDRRDTGLHSVRTEIFTRVFPRCGIPEPFGSWAEYARFVELLARTGTIVESTQLWWSIRAHHEFGTVEVRICDAQTRGEESFGLAALIAACIAQATRDYDEGRASPRPRQRELDENVWRATRYGMDGGLIDFERGATVEAAAEVERLLEWTEPMRAELGLEVALPELNGAQRARRALDAGESIESIYRSAVDETRRTYVPEGVLG